MLITWEADHWTWNIRSKIIRVTIICGNHLVVIFHEVKLRRRTKKPLHLHRPNHSVPSAPLGKSHSAERLYKSVMVFNLIDYYLVSDLVLLLQRTVRCQWISAQMITHVNLQISPQVRPI